MTKWYCFSRVSSELVSIVVVVVVVVVMGEAPSCLVCPTLHTCTCSAPHPSAPHTRPWGPSHTPHYFIELRLVTYTRVWRRIDPMIFNIWMWATLVACFVA